jgi:hypothetical protein
MGDEEKRDDTGGIEAVSKLKGRGNRGREENGIGIWRASNIWPSVITRHVAVLSYSSSKGLGGFKWSLSFSLVWILGSSPYQSPRDSNRRCIDRPVPVLHQRALKNLEDGITRHLSFGTRTPE